MDALVGLWRDQGGSKYDVTLDTYVEKRWPTCSVSISRVGGGSKLLRGVIQMSRHGCISWNKSYHLDTVATNDYVAQWKPVHGSRSFLWSRIVEPKEDVAEHISQDADSLGEVGEADRQGRWVPVDKSSSGRDDRLQAESSDDAQFSFDEASRALVIAVVAKTLDSMDSYPMSPRGTPDFTEDMAMPDESSSVQHFDGWPADQADGLAAGTWGPARERAAVSLGPVQLPEGDMLESLAGSWSDRDGFTHDVVLDARCSSRLPSCTVSTRRIGGHVLLSQGAIHQHQDGKIVWGTDYVLDSSSLAAGPFVRWFSLRGASEFLWSRVGAHPHVHSTLEGAQSSPRYFVMHDGYGSAQEHHDSQVGSHVVEDAPEHCAAEQFPTETADEVAFEVGLSSQVCRSFACGEAAGADSPLLSLIGLWSDQSGSTYDVSTDSMERGCPTLSVRFTRPDGRVKVARRVIWLNFDGRIAWNNKYFVDSSGLTLTCVRWVPAYGIRHFVWSRPMPGGPTRAPREGGRPAHMPAPTQSEEATLPCHVWKDASKEAKLEQSKPRGHFGSKAEVGAEQQSAIEGFANFEELVGCWKETITHSDKRSHSTLHKVTVNSSVGQPWLSLSVRSEKARRHARPTESTIQRWADEQIVWNGNGGYALDVSLSTCQSVRWHPLAGGQMLTWSRVEDVQSRPLEEVVGQWCDAGGMMCDVSRDEQSGQALCSCTVKFWKNSYMQSSPGLIWLTENGQIAWGETHMLDAGSSSHGFGRWVSLQRTDPEFVWYRVQSGTAPSPDRAHTERQPAGFDLSPHFCIFEADPRGIDCWSHDGDWSAPRHWDEILLSLLACVMMDGDWSSMFDASAYVGAEAIHVSGEVQKLLPPPGDDSLKSDVVTPSAWEELVWKYYGQNAPGLCWELTGRDLQIASAADTQLRRVEALLEAAPINSVALVFGSGPADVTYEDLKLQGMYRAPTAQKVFCLLIAPDSVPGIVDCFKHRLGNHSVLNVSLWSETSSAVGGMPAAKVASFLSAEFSRGTLAYAVAGLECRRDATKFAQQQITDTVSIVADFEERFFFLTGAPRNFHL